MEPVTTMIVGALVAGAVAGATEVATEAVKDAYTGLKTLIVGKLGKKSDVEENLARLEEDPELGSRKLAVQENLEAANAANVEEIAEQAQVLLDLLKESGQLDEASYNVTLSGSGAAAIGPGAVAAGEGGVATGGDMTGNISVGGPTKENNA